LILVQLSLGIFILVTYNRNAESIFTHNLFKSYLPGFSGKQRTCSGTEATTTTQLGSSFQLGVFIGIFFILDAVQYIMELVFWELYTFYIAHEFGPIRWISYSFSASIEMLCILWLSSIQDVFHICYIVSLFVLCMMCGFYGEYDNQIVPYIHTRTHFTHTSDEVKALTIYDSNQLKLSDKVLDVYFRTSYTWFWFGVPMFLLAWIQIIAQFIVSSNQLRDSNQPTIPWFVLVSIISLLVLQSTFAINCYLNLQQVGLWKSYIFTNRIYKTLSLLAKALPGLIIHFGMTSIDCST
jgi:hypothetical protein